ncbi:MAG: hypothetical protein HY233_13535 [Acidobacteriales bacterium]|nr:hypothetical protein [Candidatus Koribacter versatilis]MBI3646964.1 hypothetical protein [Terriglobales bacterium]
MARIPAITVRTANAARSENVDILKNIEMRLVYRLPFLHACICLAALLGCVAPKLSFLMGGPSCTILVGLTSQPLGALVFNGQS